MELHDQTAAAHELVAVIVLDGLRPKTTCLYSAASCCRARRRPSARVGLRNPHWRRCGPAYRCWTEVFSVVLAPWSLLSPSFRHQHTRGRVRAFSRTSSSIAIRTTTGRAYWAMPVLTRHHLGGLVQ